MKFAKLVIVVAAIVFAAFLAFAVVGMVINLLWYIVIAATVIGAAYIGYKLMTRSSQPLLAEKQVPILDTQKIRRELKSAERLLTDYKNKLTSEKKI